MPLTGSVSLSFLKRLFVFNITTYLKKITKTTNITRKSCGTSHSLISLHISWAIVLKNMFYFKLPVPLSYISLYLNACKPAGAVHMLWKAHRRGLNSLPVTTDRKSWNGMLCLSALRAAQRETIIISSALMLPPAKIHCRCSTFVTGAELPEEQMTKTRRQAGRNAEGSQTDSFWIESERQAGRFPTRRPDKFRQRYKQWCRHTDRHADNLQMYGQSYNDV